VPEMSSTRVRLLVLETEEFYRSLYQLIPLGEQIELVGVSDNCDFSQLKHSIIARSPEVLLIGMGKLEDNIISLISQFRSEYPGLGIVLLLASYTPQHIEALRKLAGSSIGGFAVFLRQSLKKIDQLSGIVLSSSYGQFILDPTLAGYLFSEKPECPFLNQLTNREREILGLLAKGYSNMAIAEELFIDIKTVEHHLNSIYSKLRAESDCDRRHLRVAATRVYLEEVGALYS